MSAATAATHPSEHIPGVARKLQNLDYLHTHVDSTLPSISDPSATYEYCSNSKYRHLLGARRIIYTHGNLDDGKLWYHIIILIMYFHRARSADWLQGRCG